MSEEDLVQRLDKTNPLWYIHWADQQDLVDLALARVTHPGLKLRIVRKVWPVAQATYQHLQENPS